MFVRGGIFTTERGRYCRRSNKPLPPVVHKVLAVWKSHAYGFIDLTGPAEDPTQEDLNLFGLGGYQYYKVYIPTRTGVFDYPVELEGIVQFPINRVPYWLDRPIYNRIVNAGGEITLYPLETPQNETHNSASEVRRAMESSPEELRRKAREWNDNHKEKRKTTVHERTERNPYVIAETLKRANGICELCGKTAPFLRKKNVPYLEVHHLELLSKGGPDDTTNTSGICPNCHKKLHYSVDRHKDKEFLQMKLKNLYK